MSATHTTRPDPTRGRWLLACAAILLQLALGAVYAWSVFAKALKVQTSAFHLTSSQAALPFSVTIGMIFVGSYIGGRIQDRRGPRTVAMTGGVVYSIGILLASAAGGRSQLWLLVLGYGVIGGFGLGLGYIVPIAMLQKWFPDKRGLITGIAVGGFGFGAVITSPIAQRLVDAHKDVPTRAFLPLGLGYLVMALVGSYFFRNPPEGYAVPGFVPRQTDAAGRGNDYEQNEALRTPQWWMLTAILTLNVTAGIGLISVAADSATSIAGYSKGAAASLVGFLGLFNGGGRIFWGWISERTGRMPAFMSMLGIQAACLLVLPHASSVAVFAILAALVYLCYGGGFGTMPATAGDFFGVRNAGAIYGLMIVGWSLGGVLGPQIVAGLTHGKNYTTAFTAIALVALVSMVLPAVTRPARERAVVPDAVPGETAAG